MDHETKPGYEPDRIPPSVFASSMTPKQEWSIQSNESLFSIHMGDQSFSKMYKSGELTNFEYIASYTNNNNIIDNKFNSTDAGIKEQKNQITVVETVPNPIPKPNPPHPIPISPTKSYRSDTSNNSAASFAFPTLQECQQDRKISIKRKSESGKTGISRLVSKSGMYPDDPKSGSGGGGGWISCFFCFSVKR